MHVCDASQAETAVAIMLVRKDDGKVSPLFFCQHHLKEFLAHVKVGEVISRCVLLNQHDVTLDMANLIGDISHLDLRWPADYIRDQIAREWHGELYG